MALGMYAASVPVYQRQLGALAKILEKGSAWAAARKVDEAVLGATRLIPDMLPLIRQVHLACRFAEESTARLAGVDVPKAHDNAEKTLAELTTELMEFHSRRIFVSNFTGPTTMSIRPEGGFDVVHRDLVDVLRMAEALDLVGGLEEARRAGRQCGVTELDAVEEAGQHTDHR